MCLCKSKSTYWFRRQSTDKKQRGRRRRQDPHQKQYDPPRLRLGGHTSFEFLDGEGGGSCISKIIKSLAHFFSFFAIFAFSLKCLAFSLKSLPFFFWNVLLLRIKELLFCNIVYFASPQTFFSHQLCIHMIFSWT